jgi:glutamate/tyrosine decarboxylase-like PLP-dependent enzyme
MYAGLFMAAFGSPSFTWDANPSHTELENVVVDYLVNLLGLPKSWLLANEGGGGFVTCTTVGYFLSLNYAKAKKMKELEIPFGDSRVFKLCAYTTRSGSSWASKAFLFKEIGNTRTIEETYNR